MAHLSEKDIKRVIPVEETDHRLAPNPHSREFESRRGMSIIDLVGALESFSRLFPVPLLEKNTAEVYQENRFERLKSNRFAAHDLAVSHVSHHPHTQSHMRHVIGIAGRDLQGFLEQ